MAALLWDMTGFLSPTTYIRSMGCFDSVNKENSIGEVWGAFWTTFWSSTFGISEIIAGFGTFGAHFGRAVVRSARVCSRLRD